MDINQVRFSNYSINDFKSDKNKGTEKETVVSTEVKGEDVVPAKAEDVLEALNLTGAYNKAQIVKSQEVNPADYLSANRISDIEAAMAEFENGAAYFANAIDAEFPKMVSQSERNALAARMFAAE